jgi:hypothetical protein
MRPVSRNAGRGPWFLAIFFVVRHEKGSSALQLQRDTGLGSYQTAWTMVPGIVAPPAGLEPATHGLGNRRSIL